MQLDNQKGIYKKFFPPRIQRYGATDLRTSAKVFVYEGKFKDLESNCDILSFFDKIDAIYLEPEKQIVSFKEKI